MSRTDDESWFSDEVAFRVLRATHGAVPTREATALAIEETVSDNPGFDMFLPSQKVIACIAEIVDALTALGASDESNRSILASIVRMLVIQYFADLESD